MEKKYQKGSVGSAFLILIATICIIIAMVGILLSPSLEFRIIFGVNPPISVSEEPERRIIQPLVTKKLDELRENLKIAESERTAFIDQPLESVTREEVENKIKKLKELRYKIASASKKLEKAKKSAKFYQFKTE
ncbi:MAG: hypothetical protein HYT61_01955 [Candidatus Yanofskybacteria bacterium]|nr:hypothetical protein [Candidatus Yanofskybacteria bacterium]